MSIIYFRLLELKYYLKLLFIASILRINISSFANYVFLNEISLLAEH